MKVSRGARNSLIVLLSIVLVYLAAAPILVGFDLKRRTATLIPSTGGVRMSEPKPAPRWLEVASAPADWLAKQVPPYQGYVRFCLKKFGGVRFYD